MNAVTTRSAMSVRFREGFGHVGPQPFFYIAPALKQMELDADCCAVKLLRGKHELDGIQAGREAMMSFGSRPDRRLLPDRDRAGRQYRQMRGARLRLASPAGFCQRSLMLRRLARISLDLHIFIRLGICGPRAASRACAMLSVPPGETRGGFERPSGVKDCAASGRLPPRGSALPPCSALRALAPLPPAPRLARLRRPRQHAVLQREG